VSDNSFTNYYDVLQVSATAEQETVHRVYRLLAQRFHPDNRTTGDADRFRLVHEAYSVLSDATRRADYDATLEARQKPRPNLAEPVNSDPEAHDVEFEQSTRLAVLEALYTQRRRDPAHPGLYDQELGEKIGVPQERLEFTAWYLKEKGLTRRAADNSRLTITAEGVEYFEQHHHRFTRRRLDA